MTELSFLGKLTKALEFAKFAQIGLELSNYEVIELLGELEALKAYIAELVAENDSGCGLWSDEPQAVLDYIDRLKTLYDESQKVISISNSENTFLWERITTLDAKISERDKALSDMVHELSRMEIGKDVFMIELDKLIEKKNDEIANLKLRIALLQAEYRWIPTNKRNPKKDWLYFARENVNQVIGYYNWNHKNGWCDGKRKNIKTVTHWMKVPKLPKEEREK
jgi:chromosome segregation ATPase